MRLYSYDEGAFLFVSNKQIDPEILNWFKYYLRKITLPPPSSLALSPLPPFQRKVLKELAQVGFGERISYQELAERSGYPGASRAVGTALKNNPYPIIYPCHRVVRKNGSTGEFLGGSSLKIKLLEFEEKKEHQ